MSQIAPHPTLSPVRGTACAGHVVAEQALVLETLRQVLGLPVVWPSDRLADLLAGDTSPAAVQRALRLAGLPSAACATTVGELIDDAVAGLDGTRRREV